MARHDDDDFDDEDDDYEDEDETGVEVTTEFFPLAWMLFFCTPHIEVGSRVYRKPWGTHFIRLKPGKHTITIYVPYLFWSRCGENSIRVRVRDGEVTRVHFYMPPLVFLQGTIQELD